MPFVTVKDVTMIIDTHTHVWSFPSYKDLSQHIKTTEDLIAFRTRYPDYFISKNKIELRSGIDVSAILDKIKKKYKNHPVNTDDGLKIEFDNDWVHLRSSNTEPIIRIYAESNFETTANNIALRLMQDIKEFIAP